MIYQEHMAQLPPPVPNVLPKVRFDLPASAMSLSYLANEDSKFERSDVLPALESYWNQQSKETPPVPAKIRISGTVSENNNWYFIFLLGAYAAFPYAFGYPTLSTNASLEIEVVTPEKTWLSSGNGKCYAGLYYPGDPSQCAFSKALTNAVLRISQGR